MKPPRPPSRRPSCPRRSRSQARRCDLHTFEALQCGRQIRVKKASSIVVIASLNIDPMLQVELAIWDTGWCTIPQGHRLKCAVCIASLLVHDGQRCSVSPEVAIWCAALRSLSLSIVSLKALGTAGQERFHALAPIYYRDAQAALLVFDITDTDSFERVKTWVKELRAMVCILDTWM